MFLNLPQKIISVPGQQARSVFWVEDTNRMGIKGHYHHTAAFRMIVRSLLCCSDHCLVSTVDSVEHTNRQVQGAGNPSEIVYVMENIHRSA